MAQKQEIAAALESSIRQGGATVAVIGLGYVGLPIALSYARAGFPVLGFDIDPRKVEKLEAGECYIRHLDPAFLTAAKAAGRFSATSDFDRLPEADVVVICVPTPLDSHRQPDLSYVHATADQIALRLRRGQLILLESTTYPGTTDTEVAARLDASGLKRGEEYFLAFSPEREDPGNPDFHTTDIPKVVGGVDGVSGDLAELFYGQAFQRVERVSSARVAEAAKLTENIFRAVNIALVNELKVVYDRMGIDVWEVLDAAATKPFGFMRFNPGPGWGGHCIPIDPFYLSWKAREHGLTPRFIELAGQVNIEMTGYVVEKLVLGLNGQGKAVKGSRILILGLAYKPDIDDPRESPAFEVLHRLLDLGAEVAYHDPHIPEAPAMRSWPELPSMTSRALTEEEVAAADAVLIITDHKAVDYDLVRRRASLIVDTRGVFREADPRLIRA